MNRVVARNVVAAFSVILTTSAPLALAGAVGSPSSALCASTSASMKAVALASTNAASVSLQQTLASTYDTASARALFATLTKRTQVVSEMRTEYGPFVALPALLATLERSSGSQGANLDAATEARYFARSLLPVDNRVVTDYRSAIASISSVRGTATTAQFNNFVTKWIHVKVDMRAFAAAVKSLRTNTGAHTLIALRDLCPTAFGAK